MHSFLAYTSMELPDETLQSLVKALTVCGERVFPGDFSLTFHFVPEKHSSLYAQKLLHFIALVPDDITLDQRRQISRQFQDATIAVLGCGENQRATLLFWKTKSEDVFLGALPRNNARSE